jgi:hypothetical protein
MSNGMIVSQVQCIMRRSFPTRSGRRNLITTSSVPQRTCLTDTEEYRNMTVLLLQQLMELRVMFDSDQANEPRHSHP